VTTGSPSLSTGEPEVIAKRIRIDRVQIDLAITEGDGVTVPLLKAAHYRGSAWPDGGSNIFIYAHARAGMFLALWHVSVGDRVVLDMTDGTERTYVVRRLLPSVAWNDVSYIGRTSKEQLTLETCTSFESTAPRFIVIATPVVSS
jgi:LPXTG-site transpeptidase (sortase) family protein